MYKILLVSSDAGFTNLAMKFIPYTESSMRALPVKSVGEAMGAIESEAVDTVVFDQSEGNDVVDMVRAMDRAGKSCPIILVSKGSDAGMLAAAINGGVSGFVDRGAAEPTEYFRDICSRAVISAERSRHSADRAANRRRLEAVERLAGMSSCDLSEIVTFALDTAVEITRSDAGYIARYDRDRRVLRMLAWSKGAMKRCEMTNYPLEFPLDTTGVWGNPIRTGKPVVINDYEGDRRLLKKGTPEGHMRLERLLMVPIYSTNGGLIGTAGVGNKPDEYTSNDESQLSLLMNEVFNVFARHDEVMAYSGPTQVVRELTEVSSLGLAFITSEMDLAFLNQVGRRILGVDPKAELPAKAEDVITPALGSVLDAVNLIRTRGAKSMKNEIYVRLGGRERAFEVSVYSTEGREGMHPGYTVVMNDITELVQTKEAAKKAKEHVSILEGPVLNALTEITPSVMLAARQSGGEAAQKVERLGETVGFMHDYKNVGMTSARWIDLEDAARSAKNLTVPAGVKVVLRTSGIKVLADPSFPSVFGHLFSNSMAHGEHVTDITVRCSIQDGSLTVFYGDNGVGLSPLVAQRYLEFPAEGKFGLYLIHKIVSASGFTFRCVECRRGAAFEIGVPAAKYSLG